MPQSSTLTKLDERFQGETQGLTRPQGPIVIVLFLLLGLVACGHHMSEAPARLSPDVCIIKGKGGHERISRVFVSRLSNDPPSKFAENPQWNQFVRGTCETYEFREVANLESYDLEGGVAVVEVGFTFFDLDYHAHLCFDRSGEGRLKSVAVVESTHGWPALVELDSIRIDWREKAGRLEVELHLSAEEYRDGKFLMEGFFSWDLKNLEPTKDSMLLGMDCEH